MQLLLALFEGFSLLLI